MKSTLIKTSAIITGAVLLFVLIANQFNTGEGWSIFDYVVAAPILFTASLSINSLIKFRHKRNVQIMAALALLAVALLYVELAVGLFGSPIAGS